MFVYEQVSGKLRDTDGNVIGIGYSGRGQWKNRPEAEGRVNEGPIPVGHYRITGPPITTKAHGPFVLRLDPDEATAARITSLGRDPNSFLMHGDSIGNPGTASEGCIIQSRGIREMVWNENPLDPDLEVVSGVDTDTQGEMNV